jgi:transcriptional regulator with XRE-family HTH domain
MNTQPPIYDYVMTNLRARQVPQRKVAAESGVPFSTLSKIAQGQTKHPSVHAIQALADYFQKLGAGTTAPQPHQEAA